MQKPNTELTLTSAPNFCNKEGVCYLVRCPSCEMENYSLNVSIGVCTWCGYDLNKTAKRGIYNVKSTN